MGFFGAIFGNFGFLFGFAGGHVIGYFFFIYGQPSDVKVDWLNKFVEMMWPYLDKAICKMIKEITEPVIVENTEKWKINSAEFAELTLGSLPSTFQGIKVYRTEEKELITELSIKWAGNPNITVAVKAFCLKAVIQAVDLHIFRVPRITLKPLVPTFPCFAKIFVSFMDKPHVDFGLKLLGADVGLYRFVLDKIKNQVANVLHDTIKNQVTNMYLWPRTLKVVVMDASKAMKKPVGILHVNVLRAQKLQKKYLMGKADPYVKLRLMDDKLPSKKTTVKKNNLNPVWNDEFKFVVADPESQGLELNVYDWEQVGKHEIMGTNIIILKHLTPDKPTLFTLELLKNLDSNDAQNEKLRGQLVTEVTYKPFKEDELPEVNENAEEVEKAPEVTPSGGGLLVVTIHEAQDLEGKHHTNPYI